MRLKFTHFKHPTRKLGKAECSCPTCGEIFASTRAFDDHRVASSTGTDGASSHGFATLTAGANRKHCDTSGLWLDHKGAWSTQPPTEGLPDRDAAGRFAPARPVCASGPDRADKAKTP